MSQLTPIIVLIIGVTSSTDFHELTEHHTRPYIEPLHVRPVSPPAPQPGEWFGRRTPDGKYIVYP